MKRKLSVLALLLAVVTLFTGCGQDSAVRTLRILRGGEEFAAAAPTEMKKITVMQFNVKNCDKGDKIDEIAAEIKEHSPDLVFLQELDLNVRRSDKKEVLKLLAEKLKMHYAFFSAIPLEGGDYGVGILSVYPLNDCQNEALPTREQDEGRILAQAKITVNGETIHLFNTHLSFEDKDKRLEQLDFISQKINSVDKFILCGDFNVESYSEFEYLQNSQTVNNPDTNYQTFNGDDVNDNAFRGIDNIAVSQNFKVLNNKMIKTAVSDHNMLIAEIEL